MLPKISKDIANRGSVSLYINGNVVLSPMVIDDKMDKIEIDLDDVGITKAENILGKDNLKLNCPNNSQ